MSVLLEQLLKQSDDPNDDSWTVQKAAACCIQLIAQATEEEVIKYTLKFIENNIRHQNWRHREAAVLAFGLIVEGPPEQIAEKLVIQVLPLIITLLNDQNVCVKDSAAWTIGRIAMCTRTIIREPLLETCMKAFMGVLNGHPKVASNICWAIHNLAESFQEQNNGQQTPLSRYLGPLIQALLARSMKPDALDNQTNLFVSCYEAINMLICSSAQCDQNVVQSLFSELVNRLRQTFSQQGDTNLLQMVQLHITGSINSTLSRLANLNANLIQQSSQQLMQLFVQLMNSDNVTVHEEVLMCISTIARNCGPNFSKFLGVNPAQSPIKNILLNGLKCAVQQPDLCRISVGAIGDIARAVQDKITPFGDEIITLLLQNLMANDLEVTVKPYIIECLSDVSLAIGGHFQRYLSHTMRLTIEAGATRIEPNSPEEVVEALNKLREAVLEFFSSILQGLANDNKQFLFCQYIDSICNLIDLVATDKQGTEELAKVACALIGDIVKTCGSGVKPKLHRQSVFTIVQGCNNSQKPEVREIGVWCRSILQNN